MFLGSPHEPFLGDLATWPPPTRLGGCASFRWVALAQSRHQHPGPMHRAWPRNTRACDGSDQGSHQPSHEAPRR